MDRPHGVRALQCERTDVHTLGAKIIQKLNSPQMCPNIIRQHCVSGVRKSSWGALPSSHRNSHGDMGRGVSPPCIPPSPPPGGKIERHSRSAKSSHPPKHIQLVSPPRHIPATGSSLGASLVRSIRRYNQSSPPQIQQPVPRPLDLRGRCSRSTGLGSGKQLCEPSLCSHPQGSTGPQRPAGNSHHHSPLVASPSMVSNPSADGHLPSNKAPQSKPLLVPRDPPRASQKPPVENIRLADLWRDSLVHQGWSEYLLSVMKFLRMFLI